MKNKINFKSAKFIYLYLVKKKALLYCQINNLIPNSYDGIILAVAHKQFKNMGSQFINNLGKKIHVIYDLKYLFSKITIVIL